MFSPYNWFWHRISSKCDELAENWDDDPWLLSFYILIDFEQWVVSSCGFKSLIDRFKFLFFKHFLGIVIYCSAWNSSSLSLNRQWWHSMHQFASRAWHLRCFHVTHRKSSPKTDMYYLYNLPTTSFSYLWCFKDFWALRIDKAQPSFSSGFNPMSEFHRKKIHYQGWYSFLHSSSVSIHFFSEKIWKLTVLNSFLT